MTGTEDWKSRPLIWLERRPLRRRHMQDEVSRQYLRKGDDVYLFRYHMSKEKAVRADVFDADPALAANKAKYVHDAYDIRDYSFITFQIRAIRDVLTTATPETLDIPTLLHTAATTRGGELPYKIAMYRGERKTLLYEKKYRVHGDKNLEVLYLLYILKKCGYMDAIFRALPELPEDFPLLLMCFADSAIRQRVEDYMGIPGLAAMYDLAFAPRRLSVRDQIRLVTFGRDNPRFQELLGTSLYRYGYHLYNEYRPAPDWYVQDFAHFRCAFCADVLLFLVSAPETLFQLRQMLDYGPGTCFASESVISQGFRNSFAYFSRTLLGYLALNNDTRLPDWLHRTLEDPPHITEHKRLKTAAFVTALQKLASNVSNHTACRFAEKTRFSA